MYNKLKHIMYVSVYMVRFTLLFNFYSYFHMVLFCCIKCVIIFFFFSHFTILISLKKQITFKCELTEARQYNFPTLYNIQIQKIIEPFECKE